MDYSYLQPTQKVIPNVKAKSQMIRQQKQVTEDDKIKNWERLLKYKNGNNLYGKEFKNTHIAMTKYGKTTLALEHIRDLVKQKLINPKRILMFSATVKSDPEQLKFIRDMKKLKPNKFGDQNTFENIDLETIANLYKRQKQLKDSGLPYKQYLLVFDDQQSSNMMKEPLMKDVFFNGRHYGINLSTNQQYDKGCIPKGSKQMFSNVVIGNVGGQDVCEELLSNFSKGCGNTKREALQKMKEFHAEAMSSHNGHGFLNVNTQQVYGNGRLQRNYSPFWYDGKKKD